MSITVHDNPDQHRFEIEVDGQLAGIAEYQRSEHHIVFPHTETRKPFGGRGLGTVLVKAALDTVRDEGLAVQPQCWFVRDFIASHPDEYLALVTPEDRAAFRLPAATEAEPAAGAAAPAPAGAAAACAAATDRSATPADRSASDRSAAAADRS